MKTAAITADKLNFILYLYYNIIKWYNDCILYLKYI